MNPDLPTIAELASILKDVTITSALLWILAGAFARKWVPGAYYRDEQARAEKAEANAMLAHDTADRATRVSEQLVVILRGMGR